MCIYIRLSNLSSFYITVKYVKLMSFSQRNIMVMKKLDMNIMETFSGVKVCLISLFMDGRAIEKMDQCLEVQKVIAEGSILMEKSVKIFHTF